HSDSGMIPDEFREPPGSEPGDPMSAITDASGPSDATDLDAVLALTNTERDAVIHTVQNNAPSIFTWDYEKASRPALNKLYEKAKHAQWDGETDLDWSIEVDREAAAGDMADFRKMQIESAG